MPKRIQRKRTKGWRMPEGAVSVTRPGKWGNPLSVNNDVGRTIDKVMAFFREYITRAISRYNPNCAPQYRGLNINELRGKDLACWCGLCERHKDGLPLGEKCDDCDPCHADILLEIANATT